MELKCRVSGRIARPVAEVFEAVVDPARLSSYFTTGGAEGRLAPGAVVTWDFADFPGRFPVEVVEVVENERIVLRWSAHPGTAEAKDGMNTVTLAFAALEDGRTLVTITETGWRPTQEGLDACTGNNQGWMQMLCAMKAWLEHGINLREGMFR